MPKFLVQGSYSPEGLKGILKEGGSGRKEAVEKLVGGLKGKLECMYFAFGEEDVYVIIEVPDNVSAAALGLAVNATGVVKIKTTALLTTEEVDRASKISVNYRPPKA
jgi:uncharacterized protein with GYD domain